MSYNIDTSESEKIIVELNEGLEVQESSSNLMSSIIQDLLDYS